MPASRMYFKSCFDSSHVFGTPTFKRPKRNRRMDSMRSSLDNLDSRNNNNTSVTNPCTTSMNPMESIGMSREEKERKNIGEEKMIEKKVNLNQLLLVQCSSSPFLLFFSTAAMRRSKGLIDECVLGTSQPKRLCFPLAKQSEREGRIFSGRENARWGRNFSDDSRRGEGGRLTNGRSSYVPYSCLAVENQ